MKHLLAYLLLTVNCLAFNLDKFADKATDAMTSGNNDPIALCTQLINSFKTNPEATSHAKGLLNTFKAEDYLNSFQYYHKIKAAQLTEAQLKTWNDVKNPLSAIILERKFSYQDSGLADLVSKASTALQNNQTDAATNYLNQLKQAATLSPEQKSILSELIEQIPLIKKTPNS